MTKEMYRVSERILRRWELIAKLTLSLGMVALISSIFLCLALAFMMQFGSVGSAWWNKMVNASVYSVSALGIAVVVQVGFEYWMYRTLLWAQTIGNRDLLSRLALHSGGLALFGARALNQKRWVME